MPRMLFLAQFAPTNGKKIEPSTPEEEFYANTYHIPIYNILQRNHLDFVSSNDIKELIYNHKNYDLVWSVFNRLGFRNSEIFVQSLCEYYKIPYIGAAPNVIDARFRFDSTRKRVFDKLCEPMTCSSGKVINICFLTVNDVAALTGLGRSTVYALFHRTDFPTTYMARKMVVEIHAFVDFFSKPHKPHQEAA